MRVRTKRDMLVGGFKEKHVTSEVTVALIECKKKKNGFETPSDAMADSLKWSLRAGSRTELLLREAHLPYGLGLSSGGGRCGGSGNNCHGAGGRVEVESLTADNEVTEAVLSADDELDRYDAVQELTRELNESFQPCSGFAEGEQADSSTEGAKAKRYSLLMPQELRELPSRWMMQSLNETTVARSQRWGVTLLDLGASVCLKSDAGDDYACNDGGDEAACVADGKHNVVARYRVCDMADMSNGQYWVEVESVVSDPKATGCGSRARVDREKLLLCPPVPVYFDPLLPVDELNNSRGAPICLFSTAMLAVQRMRSQLETALGDSPTWETFPRNVAIQMSRASRSARQRVCDMRAARRAALCKGSDNTPSEAEKESLEVRLTTDCVVFCYKGKTVEVLQQAVERLSLLWDARLKARGTGESARKLWRGTVKQQSASGDVAKTHSFYTVEPFFLRVFTLLLRYASLFGDLGYNQGPHAALPQVVMQQLCEVFDIQGEAFASPLNAQLPVFGSLFPDTDCYFGSLGSFFDIHLTAGHFEVNPPFVTALLQRLENFLLKETLPNNNYDGAASMLFVVVLPSHDLDEVEIDRSAILHKETKGPGKRGRRDDDRLRGTWKNSVSTDRALRESEYCLTHVLCRARESVYVDGHQHVLRTPLFCIGSPTRLIVLGNQTARVRYSDAAKRLESVRDAWRRFTLDSKDDDT